MNSFYFFLKTPTFRQNQFWNSSMRSEEIDRELGTRLPQLGRLTSPKAKPQAFRAQQRRRRRRAVGRRHSAIWGRRAR